MDILCFSHFFEGYLSCLLYFVMTDTGMNILTYTVFLSMLVSFAIEYLEVEIAVKGYVDFRIVQVFPDCHSKKVFPVFKKYAPEYKFREGENP